MRKKIIGVVIDILLLTGIFALVDILSVKVFHSESIWPDVCLYIALYVFVFGIKRAIVFLFNRKKATSSEGEEELK